MDRSVNQHLLPSDSETSDNDEILDNNYGQNEEEPGSVSRTTNSVVAPEDRFNFTYIIFYLLGMTSVVPWNFFITSEDYWMYKFRNVSNSSDHHLTPIQKTFTSDFCVAAAVPTTLFLILNAAFGHLISLKLRMLGSMIIIFVFFLMTTALVEVNTDSWQTGFFILTLVTVVLVNVFAAILSGGLFGVAGLFPSEYMTAVVCGQALCGMFAALAEIVSLTFSTSPKNTAFIYFIIGICVLIISIICYAVMAKTKYFRFYVNETKRYSGSSQSLENLVNLPKPNVREIFRKIYIYAFSEWFVFMVTLSVYPAVTILMQSQYNGNGHPWNDVYFTPTVNYLLFNSGDYFGRVLAGIFEAPKTKPHLVLLLTISRTIFIPILMMGNSTVHHFLPIVVHSDIAFILIMVVFAISNGYIANLALILAPKSVMQHEKEMASSIMAACLGIGLALGSTCSLVLVQLL